MIRTSKSLWSLRKNESMLISMRILSVQGKSLYMKARRTPGNKSDFLSGDRVSRYIHKKKAVAIK
jgi:hypothetical protein